MRRHILLPTLFLVLTRVGAPDSATANEGKTEQPPFAQNWQIRGIVGDVVQIRDHLGNLHYRKEGENLEGVEIIEVNPEEIYVRVRDAATGREKVLPSGTPETGNRPPLPMHGVLAGEGEGMEIRLARFHVERRPVSEVLGLLSKLGQFDMQIGPKADARITARATNMTIREFVDRFVTAAGIRVGYEPAENRIVVMSSETWAARQDWRWETIPCETLHPSAAIRALTAILEATEELRMGSRPYTLAVHASPERRAAIRSELKSLEDEISAWLEDRQGRITEEVPGLDNVVPRFEVDNRPVREIMPLLCSFPGINFVISPQVPNVPVTARLHGATVREILDTILSAYGLRWQVQPGGKVIRIVPASGVQAGKQGNARPHRRGSLPTVEGLDTPVPVFEVDNRPIKEVLNLVARFSKLNFVCSAEVKDLPVTARMRDVTVRGILDAVLPLYGLAYTTRPDQDFVAVMTQAEYDEEVRNRSLNDKMEHGTHLEQQQDTAAIPDELIPLLDTVIPSLEVSNRPLKEALNLISRFTGLSIVTLGQIPETMVTARFSNVTVREILDDLLPAYGCEWRPGPDGASISVVPAPPGK
jgi:hypothetical protein